MLVWPSRQARPKVSVTTTATVGPADLAKASRSRFADASGSTGRSTTVSGAPAFERSTPAFAHTNPWRVSQMRMPRSQRTIFAHSDSTTSIWRASFPASAAIARARSPGTTFARCTMRPSLFDTIFCAITTMSPSRMSCRLARAASRISVARSSPGRISGRPLTAVTVSCVTRSSYDVLAHVDTRLEGLGGAVRADRAAPLRHPRRGARLRQRGRERSLPSLARHRRPRAVLVVLARRAGCEDLAGPDGNERRDAYLPLPPGHRGAGRGDHGADVPGPLLPRRRIGRIDERDARGRRRMARAGGALPPAARGGEAHEAAVV